MNKVSETIAAIATPPGKGGVGIIRVSGPLSTIIAEGILGKIPEIRKAEFHAFKDEDNEIIDRGVVLFFKGPHSFTGEDVIEFQGHGGPVILDMVLQRILSFGARIARPGEFSERAFLNDKIDLSQAEAIADLIDSSSQQAARSAIKSLEGEFSRKINNLVENIIHLRMYVEAALDFPDEEIDFLGESRVINDLESIIAEVDDILLQAKQGVLLREGIHVVIVGKPNAGKSSLLNALSGRESAIVTPIPGTTRDVLREYISIEGIPLHIIDTAGLRESPDEVEREGISRAHKEMEKADHILFMVDSHDIPKGNYSEIFSLVDKDLLTTKNITILRNKIDLSQEDKDCYTEKDAYVIPMSIKEGIGLEALREHLKESVGGNTTEGTFSARRRHLDALKKARQFLILGFDQLSSAKAGELLAEDLREAQKILGEITGKFTSDDLLGRIFSSFCIGK